MRCTLVLAALSLSVAACKMKVHSTDGREMQVNDVTYVVPVEPGGYRQTGTFKYVGDSIAVSEVNGHLTVNGRACGTVKAGDTVDLLTNGRVVVNGQKR
jgi:hypothetical protein